MGTVQPQEGRSAPEVIDLREPEPQPSRSGARRCPARRAAVVATWITSIRSRRSCSCTAPSAATKYEVTKAEIGVDDAADAFTV